MLPNARQPVFHATLPFPELLGFRLCSFALTDDCALPARPHCVGVEVDLGQRDEVRAPPDPEVLVCRVPRIQEDVQRDTNVRRNDILSGTHEVRVRVSRSTLEATRRDTHPPVERLLHDRRVALCGKHEHREHERRQREHGEERLVVREVVRGAVLRAPRGAEAQRDGPDGAPGEERGDAGEVEQPREDDAGAPDRGEEGEEGDGEGGAGDRGARGEWNGREGRGSARTLTGARARARRGG